MSKMHSSIQCMLGDPQLLASYTTLSKISGGSYGEVFRVKVGNQEYALKTQLNDGFYTTAILNELNTLQLLREVPNIIQMFGVCNTRTDTLIFLQKAEFSLSQWISKTSYSQRVDALPTFLRQMVNAMYTLESVNVSHYDLKPSNILVDGQTFYLTDFGSTSIKHRFMDIGYDIGTVVYQPPEVLKRQKRWMSNPDVWSLGLCAVELCIGFTNLFKGLQTYDSQGTLQWIEHYTIGVSRSDKNAQERLMAGEILVHYDEQRHREKAKIISEYSSVINSMLIIDPKRRSTLAELMAALHIPAHEISIQTYPYPKSLDFPLTLSSLPSLDVDLSESLRERAFHQSPTMGMYEGQLERRFPNYSLINLWQFIIRYTEQVSYASIVAFGLAALYMGYVKDQIRLNKTPDEYHKVLHTVYYIICIYFGINCPKESMIVDSQLLESDFLKYADNLLRLIEFRIYNPLLGSALQQSVRKKEVYLRYYTFMSSQINDWFTEDLSTVIARARVYYTDLLIPAIYPGFIQQLYYDSWLTQITTPERQALVDLIYELSPEVHVLIYAVKLMDWYFWKNKVPQDVYVAVAGKALITAYKTLDLLRHTVEDFLEEITQMTSQTIDRTVYDDIHMDMLTFGTVYDAYQWDYHRVHNEQQARAIHTMSMCMYLTEVIPWTRDQLVNVCHEISQRGNLSPLAKDIQDKINRLPAEYL